MVPSSPPSPDFFSKGKWAEFPRDSVGIESLRTRLSVLLFKHIKKELPELRTELDRKLAETSKELGRLDTFKGDGVSGINSDDEDEDPALPAPATSTAAQDVSSPSAPTDNASDESDKASKIAEKPESHVFGKRKALDWVKETLIQTRGRELAGNFNPLLVGELFWEQSQNWECFAQKHIEEISQLCNNFVRDLLQELCPPDIYARLSLCSSDIMNVLEQRLQYSQAELRKIIAGKKLYPMTYNHYYTTTIQKLRSQRAEKKLDENIAEATSQTTY